MNLLILKTVAIMSLLVFVAAIPPLMLTCLELKMSDMSWFFSIAAALLYSATVAKASRTTLAGTRGYVIENVATFAEVRGKIGAYLGILHVLASIVLVSLASQYGTQGFLGGFASFGCAGLMGGVLIAVSFMPTALQWILEDRVLTGHPATQGADDIGLPSTTSYDKVRD